MAMNITTFIKKWSENVCETIIFKRKKFLN